MDRYLIFLQYRKTVVHDLVSFFSLYYNLFDTNNDLTTYIVESFFFLKMISINEKIKQIENLLVFKYGISVYYTLTKLLVGVMWKCHWIAICWHLCAEL